MKPIARVTQKEIPAGKRHNIDSVRELENDRIKHRLAVFANELMNRMGEEAATREVPTLVDALLTQFPNSRWPSNIALQHDVVKGRVRTLTPSAWQVGMLSTFVVLFFFAEAVIGVVQMITSELSPMIVMIALILAASATFIGMGIGGLLLRTESEKLAQEWELAPAPGQPVSDLIKIAAGLLGAILSMVVRLQGASFRDAVTVFALTVGIAVVLAACEAVRASRSGLRRRLLDATFAAQVDEANRGHWAARDTYVRFVEQQLRLLANGGGSFTPPVSPSLRKVS